MILTNERTVMSTVSLDKCTDPSDNVIDDFHLSFCAYHAALDRRDVERHNSDNMAHDWWITTTPTIYSTRDSSYLYYAHI